MNRFWLGVGILLVLLAAGIWITAISGSTHDAISALLEDAADASTTGEWEEAALLFYQAQQQWQRSRAGTAAITDHAPMEEIDRFFTQAEVYLRQHYQTDFSAFCKALSVLTKAVGEAQDLSWWSLL